MTRQRERLAGRCSPQESQLQVAERRLLSILSRDGGYWFDADTHAGSSSVTSLRCRVTGALQTFAVPAALPVASSAFLGHRVLSIATEVADSALSASAWGFLHKSAGWSVVHAAAIGAGLPADGCLSTTYDVTATGSAQAGCFVEVVGSNQFAGALVGNGTTTPANGRVVNTNGGPFADDGVASYLQFYGAAADSPDRSLWIRGTSVASGDFSGAPSSGAPAQTLRMFRNYGATVMQFVGLWATSIFKPQPFTAWERVNVLERYMWLKYGIPP